MQSFADKILDFHFSLKNDWQLPEGVSTLYPFQGAETQAIMTAFFKKYFDDNKSRNLIFGINPGRFGAGITGTPFTDPKILEEKCGIPNDFKKKHEMSAIFVYLFIEAFASIEQFYEHFYITSLCPLGFVKDGKNYNYYDSKALQEAVEQHIINHIEVNLDFGCSRKTAICMGQGKNYKYFNALNKKKGYFERIVPLPHPRWVMQYRNKEKEKWVEKFREVLVEVVE